MFKTRAVEANDFFRQEYPDPALMANVGSPDFQPETFHQVASAVPLPDLAPPSAFAAAVDGVQGFFSSMTLHPLIVCAIAVAAIVLAGLYMAQTFRTSAESGFPPSLARR